MQHLEVKMMYAVCTIPGTIVHLKSWTSVVTLIC